MTEKDHVAPVDLDGRLPFEKPRKRIVDPVALRLYASDHPLCEVRHGCKARRDHVETHHLVSRKMGGDDVAGNLVRICRLLHTQWHTWGGHEWFRRYAQQVEPEVQAKIRTALRLE